MSIKDNFPSVGPSLSLNFARSKTLDPRITFSRPSTSGDATYMNENGLIVTAAADEPRFDHKYENGVVKSLGLLVEEQRTNLFIRGSTVGDVGTQPAGLNYATTPTGQSAVVSSDFDVDGNDKSIKHTRGSSGDNNVGYYSVAGLTTGVTHSFSAYVYIPSSQQSSITSIRFGPDNNYSNLEYGYADTNIVDRWQRVVGKYDPSIQTSAVICRATASGGTYFYTDAWQLEVGEFPTSYIPTSGSTKTRSPDNVSMTGTNFSDWFNSSEGTLYASASILGKNIHTTGVEYPNGICKISDTGSSPSYSRVLYFGGNVDPDRVSFGNRDSSSSITVIDNTFGDIQSNQYYKVCGAYINNDEQAMSLNGRYIGSNGTNVNPPTPNQLLIGTGYNGAIANAPDGDEMYLNGHISQLTYYPKRLTNTQLQNLTK